MSETRTRIPIGNVDRAALLMELYHRSAMRSDRQLSLREARRFFLGAGENITISHVYERELNVRIEGNFLDPTGYDKIHGSGAALSVINELSTMKAIKRELRGELTRGYRKHLEEALGLLVK